MEGSHRERLTKIDRARASSQLACIGDNYELVSASEAGNVAKVKKLLLGGAFIVGTLALDKATDQGHTSVVEVLQQWTNDAELARAWWEVCHTGNSSSSGARATSELFSLDGTFDGTDSEAASEAPDHQLCRRFWASKLQSPNELREVQREEANEVIKHCKHGIPADIRGQAWLWLAWPAIWHAQRVRSLRLGLSKQLSVTEADLTKGFDLLLAEDESTIPQAVRDIEKDLDRSGLKSCDEQGQQTLRRVLVAFAQFNQGGQVGYCQGLNFLAVELLTVLRNEVHALWLLGALTHPSLYPLPFPSPITPSTPPPTPPPS
jgi:hypothetical protein